MRYNVTAQDEEYIDPKEALVDNDEVALKVMSVKLAQMQEQHHRRRHRTQSGQLRYIYSVGKHR